MAALVVFCGILILVRKRIGWILFTIGTGLAIFSILFTATPPIGRQYPVQFVSYFIWWVAGVWHLVSHRTGFASTSQIGKAP
ncbi:MAG: hypothetical protein HY360_13115 [Verrucomicrobia bacterium]|nr:hypothetical protein [Verrucomicrobiota bacterium]